MKYVMCLTAVLSAALVGCEDDGTGTAGLVDIIISPENSSVEPNASVGFEAFGVYDDGSIQKLDATWESSDSNIASIDADGNATGHNEGEVDVVAHHESATSRSTRLRVGSREPPKIQSPHAPAGHVGNDYRWQIHVKGGSGARTFLVVAGSLPPGLSLDGPTGFMSGSPTAAGTYVYTVMVGDAAGSDTATYEHDINNGRKGIRR